MKKIPTPSRTERTALFRLSVIGDLLARELERGDLQKAFEERSKQRYRPPGAKVSRTYSTQTLERWYYAAKDGHAKALEPKSRERGIARKLTDDQRKILLDMRATHRSVSIELILQEAIRNGVLAEDDVSKTTLTRLYARHGLARLPKNRAARSARVQRRRWVAAAPGDLWHGDVCHAVLAGPEGKRTVYVHGFLDDTSRYVTALSARTTETERDMLEVLCGALLQHPPPRTLYLDNGACYSGDLLALLCARLDIRLVHAAPYDPEARGKMERFWQTARGRCLDHLHPTSTRNQVDLALWSWLDVDYHRRKHGSLMGKTPREVYREGSARRPLVALELARALEVALKRKVGKDGTFSVDAIIYEVDGRHLATREVTVIQDGLSGKILRVTHDGRPVRFGLCDAVMNARRRRAPDLEPAPLDANAPFDPIAGLLAKAREVAGE